MSSTSVPKQVRQKLNEDLCTLPRLGVHMSSGKPLGIDDAVQTIMLGGFCISREQGYCLPVLRQSLKRQSNAGIVTADPRWRGFRNSRYEWKWCAYS